MNARTNTNTNRNGSRRKEVHGPVDDGLLPTIRQVLDQISVSVFPSAIASARGNTDVDTDANMVTDMTESADRSVVERRRIGFENVHAVC